MRNARWLYGLSWLPFLLASASAGTDTRVMAADPICTAQAGAACLRTFDLPDGAGRMHYYASLSPRADGAGAPESALVVLHGHPRDALRSFDAGLLASRRADRLADTLVIAPIYQVPDDQAGHCQSPGLPSATAGDAVWTCAGWLSGERSLGAHAIGSFAALDALVAELKQRWPSLQTVTLAGFSAGAQMLQHSVGFAADPPAGLRLRYVIADPGTWLYFDPVRPQPLRAGQAVGGSSCGQGSDFPGNTPDNCTWAFVPPEPGHCLGYDTWKYGLQSLPVGFGRDAAQARFRYAAAQIDYLEGELDSGAQKGAYFAILDKSCAARQQGPFRLQRGVAYAAYDNTVIRPASAHTLTVVPGCGHDVRCVLPSPEAIDVLFPRASRAGAPAHRRAHPPATP